MVTNAAPIEFFWGLYFLVSAIPGAFFSPNSPSKIGSVIQFFLGLFLIILSIFEGFIVLPGMH